MFEICLKYFKILNLSDFLYISSNLKLHMAKIFLEMENPVFLMLKSIVISIICYIKIRTENRHLIAHSSEGHSPTDRQTSPN